MWSQYDEDVSGNAFFKEILANHSDIVQKCYEDGWIVCIPRHGSLDTFENTFETILDHILIPQGNTYTTLSKKPVSVTNRRIKLGECQLFNSPIEILFEETFYTEKSHKYTVWCVDRPLFTTYICRNHQKIVLENIHDCIDFLWVESLTHQVLENIQQLAQNFWLQHPNYETEALQTQKDLLGKLYSQCLQASLKNNHLRDKSNKSDTFVENLKIAVETYMHYCLGRKLLESVNTVTCLTDGLFNKTTRNSNWLELTDLGISETLSDAILLVKCELNKINSFITILDKINCLQKTFQCLNNTQQHVTADDVLQILVYCILKLNINNWWSNLCYLKDYKFSTLNISNQNDFILTSMEAALEFIRSNKFMDIKLETNQRLIETSSQTTTDSLFQKVKLGDLHGIKEQLNQKKSLKKVVLCHPLCSCEKCLDLLEDKNMDLNTVNDKGQSLLIVATIWGHCHLVEYLIGQASNINSKDLKYRTALHYAALKGHQDILFLLINNEASVNVMDMEKNTPLMLASEHGHENCVKALVYSSPQLNLDESNYCGDTALHAATKWSYLEILKILIENGANSLLRNRRNKVAMDFATNCYARKMLLEAPEIIINNNNSKFEDLEIVSKECNSHGLKPRFLDQFKKIDLLLKAIENNDLPLTCFYLGFNTEICPDEENNGKKCHPLCDCVNCNTWDPYPSSQIVKKHNLSVNTCNAYGYTALHIAAKYGRLEILRLLLDASALLNVKTYSTLYTPLHLACMWQRNKIVAELLSCGGCKVDEVDSKGNTPLYYAATNGYNKIVELLLAQGAVCQRKNKEGRTIMQEVEDKMLLGVLKLLEGSLSTATIKDEWNLF